MRFTSTFVAISMVAGALGCDKCHSHQAAAAVADSGSVQYGSSSGSSGSYGVLGSESYNLPGSGVIEASPAESEYITGPHDEDGSIQSAMPEGKANAPDILSSILGTKLPFPTNSVLSAIEASLVSAVVPTASAARESFISSIAAAIPTGVSEKSEFIASITSDIAQATDAAGFSSKLSGVLASVTAAPAAANSSAATSSGSESASATSASASAPAGNGAGIVTVEITAAAVMVVVSVFMGFAL